MRVLNPVYYGRVTGNTPIFLSLSCAEADLITFVRERGLFLLFRPERSFQPDLIGGRLILERLLKVLM